MRFMMLMFPAAFYEAGTQVPDPTIFEATKEARKEFERAADLAPTENDRRLLLARASKCA